MNAMQGEPLILRESRQEVLIFLIRKSMKETIKAKGPKVPGGLPNQSFSEVIILEKAHQASRRRDIERDAMGWVDEKFDNDDIWAKDEEDLSTYLEPYKNG